MKFNVQYAFYVSLAINVLGVISLPILMFMLRGGGSKFDGLIVGVKGACHVTTGFFTPLTVGLDQWANSGQWPAPINWVVILALCTIGAASQLQSYLSGDFLHYQQKRVAAAERLDAEKSLPVSPGDMGQSKKENVQPPIST